MEVSNGKYIDYCEINNVKYINYFYHEKLVENKKK